MSLEEPAICYRKGAVLPAGAPRTLIVIGPARGGTTMIAQMLRDLRIFMGDPLDRMGQDPVMSALLIDLHSGRLGIDDPSIERFLRQRDRDHPIWGWKFPTHVFPTLYAKTRAPHVIAVFRDPVAIATREAASQGYNVEPCFARALEQTAAVGNFVAATAYSCLVVSYERALARPGEVADALAEFAGMGLSAEARRLAAERAQPGSRDYLAASSAAEIDGRIDRVDGSIAGWLRYPHQGDRRVSFALVIDGVAVWAGRADRFREDLRHAFANDGCCAFDIPTPPRFRDGKAHRVAIAISGGTACFIDNNEREWVIMPAAEP